MKKWFAFTMVICLLLAMTACAAKNKATPTTGSTGNIADTTATTDSTGAITDGTESAQQTGGTENVDPTDGAETVDSTDETENRFALDAQYASSYLEATSNYEKCEVNRQFAEKIPGKYRGFDGSRDSLLYCLLQLLDQVIFLMIISFSVDFICIILEA